MVEDAKHETERALTKLLDNFISVPEMLIEPDDVFLLMIVEAIVTLAISGQFPVCVSSR